MKITVYTADATPLELRALAAMLNGLADSRTPRPQPTSDLAKACAKACAEDQGTPVTIADSGTPITVTEAEPSAAEVFGSTEQSAADVFTQGADSSTPASATAPTAADTTPTASEASATTSTASVAAVELDKDGLPWDARIHAGTRSKCADGSWKKKRGVHDAVVEQVTAALRGLMAVPGPASTGTPAPAVAITPPDTTATPATVMTPPPGAGIAPPAGATTPSPDAPLPPFPALMRKITAAQTAGKLNPAQILSAVQSAGLSLLPDLLKRPDLIPQVEAAIDSYLLGAPA